MNGVVLTASCRAAIAICCLLLLTGCSGTSLRTTADALATPAVEADVCRTAGELTQAGEPGKALDLINQLRDLGPVPTPTGTAMPAPPPTPVIAGTACQQELADALNALGASQEPPTTVATQLKDSAPGWLPYWLAPVSTSLPIFAGTLLVLAVLSRLFATTALLSRVKLGRRASSVQVGTGLVGASLALVGGYFFTAKLAEFDGNFPVSGVEAAAAAWVWWLLAAAIISAAGAWLLAAYMASRMRVSVIMRDGKGGVDDAAVDKAVAYITDLGGSRPRGLQVPRASDVTALSGEVLIGNPTNKILAALAKIMQSTVAFVPWTVTIADAGEEGLSVVMSRNGWVQAAVTFSRESLGITGGPEPAVEVKEPATQLPAHREQLEKVAAAVVVATLARKHRGFEGLCGATDWRSIGLHYIATTGMDDDPKGAVALLAHALNADPENVPAQLALQYYQYRKSTTAEELLLFTVWLDKGIRGIPMAAGQPLKGYENLYRRMLLNYCVAALNLHSLQPLCKHQVKEAADIAVLLRDSLSSADLDADPMSIAMRQSAALTHKAILELPTCAEPKSDKPTGVLEGWVSNAEESLAPRALYNAGCWYATRLSPDLDKAERALQQACVDPELRAWAAKDPALRALRGLDWFRQLAGAVPRTSFLEIQPFAKHKAQLATFGVTTPAKLVGIAPWKLEEFLGIPTPEFDRLQRLSRLAQKAAGANSSLSITTYQIEVLALLIDSGVEVAADIQNTDQQRLHLAKEIKDRCWETVSDGDLQQLLEGMQQ